MFKIEHEKYEAEAAKNERPEIRGAAFLFHVMSGIRSERTARYGLDKAAIFPVAFIGNVCNFRPVKTNVTKIHIDGSKLKPPIEFLEIRSDLVGKVLEYGIAESNVAVYAKACVPGYLLSEVGKINLDALEVGVYDGFLTIHPVTLQAGEDFTLS